MIRIVITGTPTGNKALLYQLPNRGGKRAFVPTYRAFAESLLTGQRLNFAVVRESSGRYFGNEPEYRYGTMGECPPCRESPYMGKVYEDGRLGFRIALCEPALADTNELFGQGTSRRQDICIHFGAAASSGCLLVAGRRRLYKQNFENPMRAMLEHTDKIEVMVEPRD